MQECSNAVLTLFFANSSCSLSEFLLDARKPDTHCGEKKEKEKKSSASHAGTLLTEFGTIISAHLFSIKAKMPSFALSL